MDELDFSGYSEADIDAALERTKPNSDREVPTDTSIESDTQQMPSTEGERPNLGDPDFERRPGALGAVTDVVEQTARDLPGTLYRGAAPIVGLSDTVIDAINFASAGDTFDIPKLPEYESDMHTAVRNISGLVIPALGLRGMILKAGAKAHAAATAPKFLQSLGNSRSFSWFARFGADIGSGGLVDYVAEQNQKDDNLAGTLKKYWPKTFQWIPNSVATNDDDSAGEKRAKNVNEGAIFGLFASIVEGVAYLTKAGKSVQKTAQFVPTGDSTTSAQTLKEMTTDEFDAIKYSDNPVEDVALRNFARNEAALQELSEYYISRGMEPPNWNEYDVGEKLVRTVDSDGVPGAMADAAQIQNNIQSGWGRLGNLVSEAARKEGIELENLTRRTLVSQVTEEVKKAGKFSKKLRSAKGISARLIDEAGRNLAATLLHPRVTPDEIIGLLDEFKRSVEGSPLRLAGKKGISQAVKALKSQMLDLDVHKARAYLVTSEAGQVADFAEGARLMEEGASIHRTVELMADRLEVLQVEKGLANFEANSMLSHMNTWESAVETGDARVMDAAAKAILGDTGDRLTEIIPKAKAWTELLKEISAENPNFLKPFLLANEFTDGDVDSLYKLHEWAANNLGVFKKAIYDRNPEVPSIIMKTWWANLFNSALSAIGTPFRAGAGNLTGLLGRGTATVFGAVLEGDYVAAQKGMTAFFALDDTLQKASEHMRLVFRKASTDPKKVSYVMRQDVAIETEKGLEALRAWADAAAENGEEGGRMMLSVFEDLEALAMDPALRLGSNSMTALDGFAKSVVANTEAKYAAINKIVQSGEELTDKNLKAASEEIYNSWFDKNGMISNDSVDAITSEIALNADSPVVEGMNNFIKRFPAARSFIWFPRTTANVIDTFGKWSPAGILSADYQQLWGPFGRKGISDFSNDEIISFLRNKGRPIDQFYMETFERLRHETKGKAAIGSLFITMAGFAAVDDRCTGTGHYDKAVQRQRLRSGWKPKTCKAPGTDKVVSYEWMGPLGDWLALTIDVVDNFDSLSTSMQEDLYNKLMFLLGSAVTNRSILSQLEPLHDVLQGNGAAASRFLGSFLNNTVPLGSLRNEFGKLMYPGLRQIRAELDENLRNRNAWLDAVDPNRALPALVDPIDGKPVGKPSNWFTRVFNMGPIKVHDAPSKERQFLIDIEFNSSPTMNLSQRGAVLENHEITAINSKIGEQGIYREELRKIIRDANRLTYTASDGTVYKGFVNIIQAQRRGLISSEILDSAKYADIFSRIRIAYSRAKKFAENTLDEPMRSGIRQREYDLKKQVQNQRLGKINELPLIPTR